ncbi:hypothetical protein Hypma_010448 [Hypsizygus marmoreus]|uniref:Uncharacterized protein n=1 Tax=Hypsizygus marmoreus TaxID=39966 RepID=A0A369KBI0_HYPMA|nr:hypothetical protein Hypma_010448 [Hypsizygus marmoreus]
MFMRYRNSLISLSLEVPSSPLNNSDRFTQKKFIPCFTDSGLQRLAENPLIFVLSWISRLGLMLCVIEAWIVLVQDLQKDCLCLYFRLEDPSTVVMGGHDEVKRMVLRTLNEWLDTDLQERWSMTCHTHTQQENKLTLNLGQDDTISALHQLHVFRPNDPCLGFVGGMQEAPRHKFLIVIDETMPYQTIRKGRCYKVQPMHSAAASHEIRRHGEERICLSSGCARVGETGDTSVLGKSELELRILRVESASGWSAVDFNVSTLRFTVN